MKCSKAGRIGTMLFRLFWLVQAAYWFTWAEASAGPFKKWFYYVVASLLVVCAAKEDYVERQP